MPPTVVRGLLAPHRVGGRCPDLPPFQGGAAGYLAYDWGRTLERLPAPRYDDLAHGRRRARHLRLGGRLGSRRWPRLADFDRSARAGSCEPHARAPRPARPPCSGVWHPCPPHRCPATPVGCLTQAPRRRTASALRPLPSAASELACSRRSRTTPTSTRSTRVRDYIFAGDIFQANLSQRFEAPLAEPAWALYRRLRARNAGAVRRLHGTARCRRAQRVAGALPARRRRPATSRRGRSRARGRAGSGPSTTRPSARRSPRARRTAPRT